MYIYVCIWQCIYMYIYDKKWQPDYSNFLFLSHRVPRKFCWRSTRVVEPAVKEHFLVEFPPWMHICRGEIHFHVHLRLHWQGLHPTPGEVIWEVSCNYIASNRGWETVWLILPICKHICKTPFRDTHYLLKWKFARNFSRIFTCWFEERAHCWFLARTAQEQSCWSARCRLWKDCLLALPVRHNRYINISHSIYSNISIYATPWWRGEKIEPCSPPASRTPPAALWSTREVASKATRFVPGSWVVAHFRDCCQLMQSQDW